MSAAERPTRATARRARALRNVIRHSASISRSASRSPSTRASSGGMSAGGATRSKDTREICTSSECRPNERHSTASRWCRRTGQKRLPQPSPRDIYRCQSNCPSWRFPANCGHVNPLLKREPSRRSRLGSFLLAHPMTESSPNAVSHPYLDALQDRVLVYDGAMGTNIQRHDPTPDDFGGKALEGCNDHLVLTRPDVIQAIHESFLAVVCDVVETCTFQSTPRRLEEWGIGDRVRELNVAAARLGRAACAKFETPDRPCFVAGSIGPTGMLPSSSDPVLSNITYGELSENYYAQAKYLIEGGVDVLLVETSQDILEVKAAIAGFERLFAELGFRVPIQAQVTLDTSGRMLLGTDIASAMTTIESLDVDVLGLNCSTGPEHMREPVRYLSQHASHPISVIPNAGLPINTGVGEAVYPLEPEPMAAALAEFVRDF